MLRLDWTLTAASMLHITAKDGKNATFSLQKHRLRSELGDESVQGGHSRPVYSLNIPGKVVGMNATKAAARGYGFHEPLRIPAS